MGNHARFSPSAAHRWIECPSSMVLSKDIIDKGNSAASEGTLAHAVAEAYLRDSFEPDLTGLVGVTQEMIDGAEMYADHLKTLQGLLLIETRVQIVPISTQCWGTSDAIKQSLNELHIIDYKFGRIDVQPKDNIQLALYAIGALGLGYNIFDPPDVYFHIIQPRSGGVKTHKTTMVFLKNVIKRAKRAIGYIEKENTSKLSVGSHCRYCPVAKNCEKYTDSVLTIVSDEFENLDKPSVLSKALDNRDLVSQWLKMVDRSALEVLESGEEIEGYKLVSGRGKRVWTNEEQARIVISDMTINPFVERLKSPPALEKEMGKSKFHDSPISSFVEVSKGKLVVAPIDDKREAVKPLDEFKIEEDII